MTQFQPRFRDGKVRAPILGDKTPQYNRPLLRGLGIALLRLIGWSFEGHVPNEPKLVGIGAPHTSTWDVLFAIAAFWAIDVKMTWMAKDSLFFWPLGILLRSLGAVPVYRDQTLGVVDQSIEILRESEQMIVALAPEGTRSKVEKWKSGFYHIAHGAQVPIIFVGIDFGRKIFEFSPLFYTTGDMEADMVEIQGWFSRMVAKHPDRV